MLIYIPLVDFHLLSLHSTSGFSSTLAMKANWLSAAMTDDNLVAEVLLLLNRPDSRLPPRAKPSPPLPPLDWGIRQPRSKAAASLTKELDSRRRSPTTPLSGIASVSGSGADASLSDDFEESSLPLVSAARFKLIFMRFRLPLPTPFACFMTPSPASRPLTGEYDGKLLSLSGFDQKLATEIRLGSAPPDITSSVSSSKMTRRKRTYSELKEDEISLLKERETLNKQMDSLQMKLEEQRSCYEKLKRIKLSASVNEQMQQHNSIGHSKREASTYKAGDSNVSKKMKSEEISEYHNFEQIPIFVLPDLNMMPIEDCLATGF
ncbi:hypothetical protein V2J09_013486 [Rumex salicifolius]